MQRGLCVLALLLAGCWGPGERAPWNRANTLLTRGQGPPGWLNDAIKDANGDNMRMQGEVGKSPNARKPRSPSSAGDN